MVHLQKRVAHLVEVSAFNCEIIIDQFLNTVSWSFSNSDFQGTSTTRRMLQPTTTVATSDSQTKLHNNLKLPFRPTLQSEQHMPTDILLRTHKGEHLNSRHQQQDDHDHLPYYSDVDGFYGHSNRAPPHQQRSYFEELQKDERFLEFAGLVATTVTAIIVIIVLLFLIFKVSRDDSTAVEEDLCMKLKL
ncbi:hypothetical protein HELRODRAFT_159177 [Helobdella robusta]|uniref:Uncharacterized protein n=1 Tax=Helobdella robusta TaxID=6412 RepID=T1ENP8_HELRO|nr:hypothetical protein HELRODRAFT_159177 [Helobdella robusta]ESO12610.1 hypothetical protein HELRODRAFT_159177 [Helobdella robusta]